LIYELPGHSDWIADYLKGRPSAVAQLRALEPHGLAISLISYGEIFEGIYFSSDPVLAERDFRQFLRAIDVLPLNRAIMRHFARIRGELRRRGQIIGDPDLMIAATAIEHDLALITGNRRHFARIAELALYLSEESD
jgi:predicted nucleic acid-binding protein